MFKDFISKASKAMRALVMRKVEIECDRIPHEFHGVPITKILNWIKVEASILRKPERPWGWPTHLMIEPTNHCNLRCALCPLTSGMSRPRGHMDLSLFKRIIDETGDYVFFVLLWNWGEPFLNPSVFEMISYAKNKGIRVVSSTNGHFLAKAENADKVIRSGLDTLIVAIDGIKQETYERYRQGGDLEAVLGGIRTIEARKRDLKSRTPLVNLRFIVMKQNEHEIPGLEDLARSVGVDVLTLKTLNDYLNVNYHEGKYLMEEKEGEFLPDDSRYRRFETVQNGKTLLRLRHNPCKNLWNNPVIDWDGTVCPCTYDFDEKYILGDLNKTSFKDIWFGPRYGRIRRQFRSDWKRIGLCGSCSYALKGGSSIEEIIPEAVFFNLKDYR